jgi:APA family basic amino acid/polyamine antiporter
MSLSRSVSLPQAILYGLGIIVGAGIYTLIGLGAGIAGNALWVSFLIAGFIAALTALTYAELSNRFAKEAAETNYMIKAFKSKGLGFFAGYLILITSLFSAATVAYGFSAYFRIFFNLDPLLTSIILIVLLSVISLLGMQESVKLNNSLTYITILGLILILIFGFRFIGDTNLFAGINGENIFQDLSLWGTSLFPAAALIFFAFLGFEQLANISEEVINPKENVPRAILFSLLAATILYILVSIVAVSAVPVSELSKAANPNVSLSQGPLALVAEKTLPGFGFWLSIMALCATSSTLLILLVVSSRIIYGMSEQDLLPTYFRKTHPRFSTPHYAILVVMILAIFFALIGNIELLGNLTTLGVFLVFFLVHAALIQIRLRENTPSLAYDPLDIGRIPIHALLGVIFCGGMFLTQYWSTITILGIQIPIIILGSIIFLTAIPIHYYFEKRKNHNHQN